MNIALPRGFEEAKRFAPDIACAHRSDGSPLIVTPLEGTKISKSLDDWRLWMQENSDAIRSQLDIYGALLFRNFPVGGTSGFQEVFSGFTLHGDNYGGGVTPRDHKTDRVMTATRLPSEFRILLHQEKAYAEYFPKVVAFHCVTPASSGGETTIGDMRRMRGMLPRQFIDKLDKLGVLYRRHFFSPDFIKSPVKVLLKDYFRTWDAAFFSQDRSEIERICANLGKFRWNNEGGLEIEFFSRGSVSHPSFADDLWFNQIATLHLNELSLGQLSSTLKRLLPGELKAPTEVLWGDGSVIEIEEIRPVYKALDALTVSVSWMANDIMLMDNLLTAHGRHSFVGSRDIEVSLFDAIA